MTDYQKMYQEKLTTPDKIALPQRIRLKKVEKH